MLVVVFDVAFSFCHRIIIKEHNYYGEFWLRHHTYIIKKKDPTVKNSVGGGEMKKILFIIFTLCILFSRIVKADEPYDYNAFDFEFGPMLEEQWKNCSHVMYGSTYFIEVPILEVGVDFSIESESEAEVTMDFLNSVSYSSFTDAQKTWDHVLDLFTDINLTIYNKMKESGIEDPASVLMIEDVCGDNQYDDVYYCVVNGDVISKINDIRKVIYVVYNKSNLKSTAKNDVKDSEEYTSLIGELSSENESIKDESEALKAGINELKS